MRLLRPLRRLQRRLWYRVRPEAYIWFRLRRMVSFCPRSCLFGFTVELFKLNDKVVQKDLFLYLPLIEVRVTVWRDRDYCIF